MKRRAQQNKKRKVVNLKLKKTRGKEVTKLQVQMKNIQAQWAEERERKRLKFLLHHNEPQNTRYDAFNRPIRLALFL